MQEKPNLSIVIPILNEEGNLRGLYDRVTCVLRKMNLTYEIIAVDDGSSDNSLEILNELNKNDSRVKILSFSRNFGHMAALSAGLDYSTGDAVITMDADLQHPPELILQLVNK